LSVNQLSRRELLRKVSGRFLAAILILGAMFFLPAGTIFYWEAWTYLAILFIPVLLVLLYLIKNEPDLLERRMRMREKEAEQKLIIKLSFLYFLVAFLLPGFDQRYGWSSVPTPVVIMADMIVLLGYALFFLVLKENRYEYSVMFTHAHWDHIMGFPFFKPIYVEGTKVRKICKNPTIT